MKKNFLYTLIFIILSTQIINAQTPKTTKKVAPSKNIEHRLSGSLSFLINSNPFLEMAFFDKDKYTFYALQYKPWLGRGDSAYGLSLGAAYDATFKNGFSIRVQTGLETSGFIAAMLDVGAGINKKVVGNNSLRIEIYLATMHTGGQLALLSDNTDRVNVYTFLLGAKVRAAFEMPIVKKFSLSPYISYAAYPYNKSSKNVVFNGGFGKYVYDSFHLGLEFSYYL